MTLTPETRVLLTDALRPPAGYRVDVAVGTTYSLNLTAMLLAPLSFALFDQGNAHDIGAVDPIRLLEAVRRHADHTTVFCQAGGIHVPGNYRSILTFVEDSVLEVLPPHQGAIFHPKVWAIRFESSEGKRLHRVVILSRNLTLDRSWDTALVLDEDEAGTIDPLLPQSSSRTFPDSRFNPSTSAERQRFPISLPRWLASASPHRPPSPAASSSRSASMPTASGRFRTRADGCSRSAPS